MLAIHVVLMQLVLLDQLVVCFLSLINLLLHLVGLSAGCHFCLALSDLVQFQLLKPAFLTCIVWLGSRLSLLQVLLIIIILAIIRRFLLQLGLWAIVLRRVSYLSNSVVALQGSWERLVLDLVRQLGGSLGKLRLSPRRDFAHLTSPLTLHKLPILNDMRDWWQSSWNCLILLIH